MAAHASNFLKLADRVINEVLVDGIGTKLVSNWEQNMVYTHKRYPANICWSSRHVLKTSSTRLQRNSFSSSMTSWRRLEDVLQRRLEDISQDILKTSWKRKTCYAEDILKTSWRHVLKTFWLKIYLEDVLKTCLEVLKTSFRRLGDKQNVNWGYMYLTNLNMYLKNYILQI